MDYLVTATPTGGLLELPAEDRDALMSRERQVATELIRAGVITWMWRLPDSVTTVAIWSAENAEDLDAHLRSLPVFPHNTLEITPLTFHPAFPAPLRTAASS